MLSIEEALAKVLDRVRVLPPRKATLTAAGGRLLAEDVVSDLDLPPFDKSVVDGYAVRIADLREGAPTVLRIGEEITAGKTPTRPLARGEAAFVMTGAPLPEGADAVVMHEETRPVENGACVEIQTKPAAGRNRMPRASELRSGDLVLKRGAPLTAARLGVAASVGRAELLVHPRPRIGIVPTGDELVGPSQRPGPGQIRESNTVVLAELARALDAEVHCRDVVSDDPSRLRSVFDAELRGHHLWPTGADVLVICGGVSGGTKDLVPATLEALDVEQVFHKVRLKPGKPIWFGTGPPREKLPGTLVFGLPGNPVSSLVCFKLFVEPALRALAGFRGSAWRSRACVLASEYAHRGDRPTHHPARLVGVDRVEPLGWAGSADLRTVADADGFAVFAAGDRVYAAGESVPFLPLDSE